MLTPDLLTYLQTQYGTVPEQPWAAYPENLVLRHPCGKWYGIILPVQRAKLGLSGEGQVIVINLKCGPILAGTLRQQPGVLPAWHMSKTNWNSVLLDGTVPMETIQELVALSYHLVGPKG